MLGRMLTTVSNKGRYSYAYEGDIIEYVLHTNEKTGRADEFTFRVTAINGLLCSPVNPIIVDIRNDFEFVPSEEFQ